eukprot:gene15472-32704_t
MSMTTQLETKYKVQSLERGLSILRELRASNAPVRNHDLVNRTRLPKATVSRLLNTLTALGCVRRIDLGSYVLDHASGRSGRAMVGSLELKRYLELFRNAPGPVYLEAVVSGKRIPVYRWFGSCGPLANGCIAEMPPAGCRDESSGDFWAADARKWWSWLDFHIEGVGAFVLTVQVSQQTAPKTQQLADARALLQRAIEAIWNDRAGHVPQTEWTGVVARVHTMEGPAPGPSAKRKVAAPRQAPSDDFVGALGHGIALLNCWTAADVWLTNSDLAGRSGLTKSSVFRLASVLVDLGYLSRERQRGRLRLAAATLELGFGSPFASEPVASVHSQLAKLAKELDVYAALGIRRVDKIQVLDNAPSPLHPHSVALDVGGLLPIFRSASGLAAYSALPDAEAAPLMERLRTRYSGRWSALQRQLNATKLEYSSKGYCSFVAGLSRDVAAVAVPISPAGSNDIFVLGCGMAATEYHRERVEDAIVPQMLRVARDLAFALEH